jgi:hypothetical protein
LDASGHHEAQQRGDANQVKKPKVHFEEVHQRLMEHADPQE